VRDAQSREHDDVVYEPVSRRDLSRPAITRPPVNRATRSGRPATVEISRLACLKAALRNFF
jgi:hypothetical protein